MESILYQGRSDVTIEAAIAILAEIAGSVHKTCNRPRHKTRHIFCDTRFLVNPAIYNPDKDHRYLIVDGMLLLVDDIRVAREYNHYRVTLAGSKTPIPVEPDAPAYVTEDPSLAGVELSEIL